MPINRWAGGESSEDDTRKKPDSVPSPPPVPQSTPEQPSAQPEPAVKKERVYSWSSDYTQDQPDKQPGEKRLGTSVHPQGAAFPGGASQNQSGACKHHPAAAGTWKCERCGMVYCTQCVAGSNLGGVPDGVCPDCGGLCKEIDAKFTQRPVVQASLGKEFIPLLLDAFVYPLRGKGILLLIGGTMLVVLSLFAAILARIFGLIILFTGGAYICAFLTEIIATSARGQKELPDWPSVRNMGDDLIVPFGKFIGTALLCFGPLIVYILYSFHRMSQGMFEMTETGEMVMSYQPSTALIYALAFLGYIYWPMSIIAAALGYPYVFNPAKIFGSIGKTILHYIVAILFIIAAGWVVEKGQMLLMQNLGPFLGGPIGAVMSFYMLAINMRVYGLVYYANEDVLDWE